ncbi:MAG: hypothetical protein K0Q57_682 [Gammaproteobacteria bacterium]|jgi:phospholipid N-methyltransferase|nr:hypothetical protein [Gammaproteobacteria bacterium]
MEHLRLEVYTPVQADHLIKPNLGFKFVTHKNLTWTNKDNDLFYNHLPKVNYDGFLAKAGLDNNCDIALIVGYILAASSIIEIGAGYGRVIKAIKDFGYSGKLAALERCKKMCHYLKQHFNNESIIQEDFLNFKADNQYDLTLMMFATISTFSMDEQKVCFKKMFELLKAGGKAVVETVISNTQLSNASRINSNYYSVNFNGYDHIGYNPSPEELEKFGLMAGFEVEDKIIFKANTANRIILIFKKP